MKTKPATKKAAKTAKPRTATAAKPLTVVQRLDAVGIAAICDYVASGESLQSYCTNNGFSPVSMLRWIDASPKRMEDYAHARQIRADLTFDSLDDLSDDAVAADNAVTVAGLRLKCDNIKWKLARMNSKKYGEKVTQEHTGDGGGPLKHSISVVFVDPT